MSKDANEGKGKPKSESAFENINSYEGLVKYLNNPFSGYSNNTMVYHYTNLDAAIKIISGGFWCLRKPNDMNDGLEPLEYNTAKKQIYFDSFMFEQKESIAMWAMYAQPWSDGVMIAIPLDKFKNWVKGSNTICCADKETKAAIIDHEGRDTHLSATRVAYSLKDENGIVLSVGSGKNKYKFKSLESPALTGYIKDDAWSYEKELRLRVDSEEDNEFGAVAVKIPDEVINSMIITKGPRFEGDLMERIQEEIHKNLKTSESLFYKKLNYVPCDSCKAIDELKRKLREVNKQNEQQLV